MKNFVKPLNWPELVISSGILRNFYQGNRTDQEAGGLIQKSWMLIFSLSLYRFSWFKSWYMGFLTWGIQIWGQFSICTTPSQVQNWQKLKWWYFQCLFTDFHGLKVDIWVFWRGEFKSEVSFPFGLPFPVQSSPSKSKLFLTFLFNLY